MFFHHIIELVAVSRFDKQFFDHFNLDKKVTFTLTFSSNTRSAACNKDREAISSTSLFIFASPASGGTELEEPDELTSVLASLRLST
jgi:hypothetical protein